MVFIPRLLLFTAIVLTLCGLIQSFPTPAYADQPIPMIRTLCMPDKGIEHFSAHVEVFHRLADYIRDGGLPPTKDTRRDLLSEQYGLLYPLSPAEYSYSCTLGSSAYKIYGYRPPHREKGMCGGNPRIILTFEKNGATILDKLYFEPSCRDLPHPAYIVSFSIDETTFSSFGISSAIVSDGNAQAPLAFSKMHGVLTQAKLDCLAEEGYFNRATRHQATKTCLESTATQPNRGKSKGSE